MMRCKVCQEYNVYCARTKLKAVKAVKYPSLARGEVLGIPPARRLYAKPLFIGELVVAQATILPYVMLTVKSNGQILYATLIDSIKHIPINRSNQATHVRGPVKPHTAQSRSDRQTPDISPPRRPPPSGRDSCASVRRASSRSAGRKSWLQSLGWAGLEYH
jgi:hypothetical protein